MEPINRVASALDSWNETEKRLERIFGAGVIESAEFNQEKLRNFQDLLNKYTHPLNLEERISLRIVREQTRRLSREVYPNFFVRLFHRIIRMIDRAADKEKETNAESRNLDMLKKQVQGLGFGNIGGKVEALALKGGERFDLPVSYFVDPGRKMDFKLFFERERDGIYRLEKYQAALTAVNEASSQKLTQMFWPEDGIGSLKAQNLLLGRPVKQGAEWLQLDFNDRSAEGNFTIKRFPEQYFDLSAALEKLEKKLEISLSDSKRREMLGALSEGKKAEMAIPGDRRSLIRLIANPQFRTLDLYKDGKKISPVDLTRKEATLATPLWIRNKGRQVTKGFKTIS